MTRFSFMVPIPHLKDFEPYQDFTFALSFALSDPTYKEYVNRRCELGDTVYIDNSFNETQVAASPEEMAKIYFELGPTAVISPDHDDWTLLEVSKAFRDLHALNVPTSRIMGVFRNDLEREFFQENSTGPLAVSYWWVDHVITPIGLDKVHFLGLGALETVKKYHPASLDTSQMVKMALKGQLFEEWDGVLARHQTRALWPERKDRLARAWDFLNTRMTDRQVEMAIHNMQALKACINEDHLRPGQLANQRQHVSNVVPVDLDVVRSERSSVGV